MANFYAQYPSSGVGSTLVQTVQGEGTAGTPTGGILTIQGDPAGTPVPVSGTLTATNPSVGVNGAPVPADSTYVGMNVAGTLTGLTGSASGLNTVVNAALPAGSAIIGKVGIDQTTPGTTNGVQVNAALPAGSAIIGKFGIDQTTPGTTNGVQVNAALPAGTAIIGKFGIDQTIPGTTNAVAITSGTAIIGKVSIDQTNPGTTNGVQATSGTTVAWQAEGNLAFGSITNAYATIFTPTAATKVLFMRNNTNAAISVSMDAGVTTNFIFDSGDQLSLDFITNGLVSTTSAIQIKYTSGAPTSGSFRVNGGH